MTPQTAAPEREAVAEAALRTGVAARGGMCLKLAPTGRGIPDRLVLLPGGRSHLVELKSPMGRLSAAQKLWHERANQRGHRVFVLAGRQQVAAWLAWVDQTTAKP